MRYGDDDPMMYVCAVDGGELVASETGWYCQDCGEHYDRLEDAKYALSS